MASLLVIDDDPLIGRFLERGLRAAGHAVTLAADAVTGHSLAISGTFDLVLLDLVLGEADGYTILRDLRARHRDLPVLVITGFPDRRGVVDCLEGGADDYLIKPFRFDELLARIRARLRTDATASSVLAAGDLQLDLLTRRAMVSGCRIDLTAREFSLLESFLRHPDQVLSRAQLVSQVWGYSVDPASNIVNVYIAALRRKIGEGRIETVRGAGYRLLVGLAPQQRAVPDGAIPTPRILADPGRAPRTLTGPGRAPRSG